MHTLEQLRSGQLHGSKHLSLNLGLSSFPPEIFDLADSLEVLDLSNNALHALPADLHRLQHLRVLFCSNNPFDHLPEALGTCPALSIVGFRACRIETVSGDALPAPLRTLILTDNRIRHLPDALGERPALQKLMLAGNLLSELPASLAQSDKLELLRIAANRFHTLPDWLLQLPRLAWLACAGNPCTDAQTADALNQTGGDLAGSDPTAIDWNALQLTEQLGEGASGRIYRALWQGPGQPEQAVAVKLFKGQMTSDGLPHSEMAVSLAAGEHPHLIGSQGRIVHHPEHSPGLVMALIDQRFTVLAGPPSLETCTRDLHPATPLSLAQIQAIAGGIAAAAAHLHQRGLLHGDLYAHNTLVDPQGQSLLGDFGAASFYPAAEHQHAALQRIEVRAWGILLEELLQRGDSAPDTEHYTALQRLAERCQQPEVVARPSFAQIVVEMTGPA